MVYVCMYIQRTALKCTKMVLCEKKILKFIIYVDIALTNQLKRLISEIRASCFASMLQGVNYVLTLWERDDSFSKKPPQFASGRIFGLTGCMVNEKSQVGTLQLEHNKYGKSQVKLICLLWVKKFLQLRKHVWFPSSLKAYRPILNRLVPKQICAETRQQYNSTIKLIIRLKDLLLIVLVGELKASIAALLSE